MYSSNTALQNTRLYNMKTLKRKKLSNKRFAVLFSRERPMGSGDQNRQRLKTKSQTSVKFCWMTGRHRSKTIRSERVELQKQKKESRHAGTRFLKLQRTSRNLRA
jgi:hypothetical protein